MKKLACFAILSSIFASTNLFAAIGDFEIHAFMSAGVAKSDVSYLPSGVEPYFSSYIEKQPTFKKDTNVGVQLTKSLREDVSFTLQLYAEGADDFDVDATWAFLKWEPSDSWQFRAGRVRANIYMLSDHIHVAYAYPWIRLPQEVYTQTPLNEFSGVDVRYKHQIFNKDLSLYAFWGFADTEVSFAAFPNSAIMDTLDMKADNLYSFEAIYGDEVFHIRAAYVSGDVSLVPDMSSTMSALNNFLNTLVGSGILGTDYVNYFSLRNRSISFADLGYEFNWKNIVSKAEISKRHSPSPVVSSVIGWYVMGGYQIKDIMPHITFARERVQGNYTRRFPSIVNAMFMSPPINSRITLDDTAQSLVGVSTHFEGGVGDQSSVTLGVRWDIYEGIAIKAEYERVHPDNRSPGLFDFNPLKSVNIYSFAVNAVI